MIGQQFYSDVDSLANQSVPLPSGQSLELIMHQASLLSSQDQLHLISYLVQCLQNSDVSHDRVEKMSSDDPIDMEFVGMANDLAYRAEAIALENECAVAQWQALTDSEAGA